MRIAVIGTGISGNLVANLLSSRHEVTVFESQAQVGGHSKTVDVEMAGHSYPADVGFMVFNRRTYPGFCEMLERLDVASRDSDMSFSVHCQQSGREYQGSSLNGLFAQRLNLVRPSFHRMIFDILRFNRLAIQELDRGDLENGESVGELIHRLGLKADFQRLYLVPMAAAIWSAVPNRILDFPAKFMVGFLKNHGLLQIRNRPQWMTIVGGSKTYVQKLTAAFRDRIRLGQPVRHVTRSDDHVVVRLESGETEIFDQVVFACHSDQALEMIGDPTQLESEVLGAIPYQKNKAVLHTDESFMPERKHAWASWNYHVPEDLEQPASVTYDLSRLQGHQSPRPILLTLNRAEPIANEHTIRSFDFEHPVFGPETIDAQARHSEISGLNRTHFCGAYWRYGFHEDGVQSALRVAKRFDLTLQDLNLATKSNPNVASESQNELPLELSR